MANEQHATWLETLLGDDSRRAAATKVGVAQTTITRQLQRDGLSAEMVIALCRAYDRDAVQGLIETGYLREWEGQAVGVEHALDQASNRQLLDAVMRRSDPNANYLFGISDDVINPDDNVVVFESRSNTASPGVPTEVDDDDPLAGINPEEHAAHPKTKPMETDHWT